MKHTVSVGIFPADRKDEDDSIMIHVMASEEFVVYYVVRTLFGCEYNPNPKNVKRIDDDVDEFEFIVRDRVNFSVQYAMIDVLSRLKRFPEDSSINFQTSNDCWVEKFDDDDDAGLQFSFNLRDENLRREKAAYRIRYGDDVNDQNISEFYKIEDGPLVCNKKRFHDFVGDKASRLMHPNSKFAQNLKRKFEHRAGVQQKNKNKKKAAR